VEFFVTLNADGVRAAADREKEFHPKTSAGKDITAWDRRATSIEALVKEVNALGSRVAELEARPVAPFPVSG